MDMNIDLNETQMEEKNENEQPDETPETENPKESPEKLRVLYLILSGVFAVVTILCSIIIVRGWLNPDVPPSVFGVTPAVMGDICMESDRDDAISYGDILFLKKTDTQALETGDIIAFYEDRIVYIGRIQTISKTEDDISCVVRADGLPSVYPHVLTNKNFVGTVGLQVKGLGSFALFVITPLGTFLCCWIPAIICLAILLYEWWTIRKEAKLTEEENPEDAPEETPEENPDEIHNGDSEKADSEPDETN
ncbi:MAG: hypothetical protein IJ489_04350 [Clostridia bacterium]|nr:hypothetical protein [Clostridia bacterium]